MNSHRDSSRRSPNRPRLLPLLPLLEAYRTSPSPTGTTVCVEAVRLAAPTWLNPGFLDDADDASLATALGAFYTATHPVAFHPPGPDRRMRFLRHALNHLLRGQDPLPERLARCVTPGEVYSVAGFGPTFWSAVVKALDPDGLPVWCPATERGLARLGLLREATPAVAARFAAMQQGYEAIRAAAPDLTAWQIDDFLERVGRISGRELPADTPSSATWSWQADPERIRQAVREVRVRTPLRRRIREARDELTAALRQFQEAARACAHEAAWEAFRGAFPDGRWEQALAAIDDAYSPSLPAADRARLWCEVAAVLREQFRVHPLELADVVLAAAEPELVDPEPAEFGGFCSDTFRFLGEITAARSKEWMAERRDRYQFVLREPLVELCEALAGR